MSTNNRSPSSKRRKLKNGNTHSSARTTQSVKKPRKKSKKIIDIREEITINEKTKAIIGGNDFTLRIFSEDNKKSKSGPIKKMLKHFYATKGSISFNKH
eukprot:194555_1